MRTRSIGVFGILAFSTALAATAPVPAPATEAEERGDFVLLYPSYLTRDPGTGQWRGQIHGRVYRPEHGAYSRVARATLRATLGAVTDPTPDELRILDGRSEQFAVDAERGKRVHVVVGDQTFVSHRSRPGGHFVADVALPGGAPGATVPFRVRLDAGGSRAFEGKLRLLGPEGVSVISDIDDTVKVSNVPDRAELAANTFLRPYRAVSGMPELYGSWGARGAAIHYVTASPWQLFPPLWSFLTEGGFPGDQIEMREVRVADASMLKLLRDSRPYKMARIREILRLFPERGFVLVGDSGERDPEVYAAIAKEFPASVRGIFIRAIAPAHLDRSRYRGIFSGIDESRWIVFSDPAELPRDLEEWIRRGGQARLPSGGSADLCASRAAVPVPLR